MIDLALLSIIAAIAAFGLWLIVGWAKISEAPRQWLADAGDPDNQRGHFRFWLFRRVSGVVYLLECPTCFGFWEGLAIGYAIALGTLRYNLAFAFASGLFIAATNTLLVALARGHLYPENDDDLEDG